MRARAVLQRVALEIPKVLAENGHLVGEFEELRDLIKEV
jgi:hypothetical protein